MRKILPNNEHTRQYLSSLPKIYMIACWAGYGIREFPYAGKCDPSGIPYVYDYVDCNGALDEYHLMKLTSTTTGRIKAWSTSKSCAQELANSANIARDEEWRNIPINKPKEDNTNE